ncbi:hypothetical protein JNW88_05265 [Micromonospora sp. ATA32]|nr:hypothetical protein [Micromonospora sp. ATA32]
MTVTTRVPTLPAASVQLTVTVRGPSGSGERYAEPVYVDPDPVMFWVWLPQVTRIERAPKLVLVVAVTAMVAPASCKVTVWLATGWLIVSTGSALNSAITTLREVLTSIGPSMFSAETVAVMVSEPAR